MFSLVWGSNCGAMWSRLNLEGLRQRWASTEDDAGWSSGSTASRPRPSGANPGVADRRIQREFIARETIIDCPHRDCPGIYVTGRREIRRAPGTGSRVILRCTRRPSDHESTLSMPAYSTEEREALRAAFLRNETPRCTHCKSQLELRKTDGPGVPGTPAEGAASYYCSWCGVKWVRPDIVQPRKP